MTIISATSGDTGAAAVEAFKTSKSLNLFILFPLDRFIEQALAAAVPVPVIGTKLGVSRMMIAQARNRRY